MEKIINRIDHILCSKTYLNNYNDIDIEILLKSFKNPVTLYNKICNHPNITPEIIISILKQIHVSMYSNLGRCRLINQEFCDKYKDTCVIHPVIMIKNRIPVEYITATVNGYVFDGYELYNISTYCTYEEYIKYCKPADISPSLYNPNMTIEWLMDNIPIDKIVWETCVLVRPDLFTVDVIIKYKEHIGKNNKLWSKYFYKLPVTFIEENIHMEYCEAFYNCITIFKKHPCGLSWNTIDKYISVRKNGMKTLNVSNEIVDLPRWFVYKHKDRIQCICFENVNEHVNYKFIIENGIVLTDFYSNIHKCRSKYIALLDDIVGFCDSNGIPEDLHGYILEYS